MGVTGWPKGDGGKESHMAMGRNGSGNQGMGSDVMLEGIRKKIEILSGIRSFFQIHEGEGIGIGLTT